MKKIVSILLGLISIFLISCSNMQIGFEEDSMFYRGGIVYIYLDVKDNNAKYKVYINGEDTEVTLANHAKTRFGVQNGQTKIEIAEGKKRVSINLFLSKLNNYYLKVTKNKKSGINILQVQKNDISADVDETPLYIDETAKKKADEKEAKAIISDYGEEPAMQELNASINENTKTPANGDTIFYYNAQDGE